MKLQTQAATDAPRILPEGHLDLSVHRQFRDAVIEAIRHPASTVTVDMKTVHSLDSAALGMLLMLKEMAQDKGKSVRLLNATGAVRETLSLVRLAGQFDLA